VINSDEIYPEGRICDFEQQICWGVPETDLLLALSVLANAGLSGTYRRLKQRAGGEDLYFLSGYIDD
jgi:hypothetical protein